MRLVSKSNISLFSRFKLVSYNFTLGHDHKVSFEVFNAGGDVNNATKQMIVDTLLEKIPDGKVHYLDHGSDPRNYRVSFEKVKSVLGFEPEYTIQDGIEELIIAIENHVFDDVDERCNFFGNYEIDHSISSWITTYRYPFPLLKVMNGYT